MELDFDEEVALEGVGPEDSTFFLELEVGELRVDNEAGFKVDASEFLLQLGSDSWPEDC